MIGQNLQQRLHTRAIVATVVFAKPNPFVRGVDLLRAHIHRAQSTTSFLDG